MAKKVAKKAAASSSKDEKPAEKRKVKIYKASGKLDRTKRSAKTADVSDANVIKPRLRKRASRVNYAAETSITRAERSVARKKRRNVKRKRSPSPSEDEKPAKRAKRTPSTEKKEEKEPAKSPKKTTSSKKKKETKPKKQEDEEKQEEAPKGTPKKEKATANVFSDAVIAQVERLGGTFVLDKKRRPYRTNTESMPIFIQQFLDTKWKKNSFKSDKYQFDELHIEEFDIEDYDSIDFLKDNDAVLLGYANKMLAVKAADKDRDDFNVYIIDDEAEPIKIDGPIRLSAFLATLEVKK